MIGIVQALVILFILVSFSMVIGIPVILATPDEWETSSSIVWGGAGLWVLLIIALGALS